MDLTPPDADGLPDAELASYAVDYESKIALEHVHGLLKPVVAGRRRDECTMGNPRLEDGCRSVWDGPGPTETRYQRILEIACRFVIGRSWTVSGAESIAEMKGDQPVSTVTTASATTVNDTRSRLTSTIPRATASVGVLAAAAATAGAAALRVAGDPLAVHGEIPLAAFAQISLIGAILGGILLTVLNRRSSDPHRRFIQMTIGLTALSCVAPAAFADSVASRFALVALHLVAAAIIVPVLARQAN